MHKLNIFKSAWAEKNLTASLPYIAFFFATAFMGWLWEVIVYWVRHGWEYDLWYLLFYYRGVLHGPWAPIYGVGGVLMVLIRRLREQSLLRYFLTCTGVCASMEYLTSLILEMVFHAKWWDYTGYFLNLNGRICAMSLVAFALAGMAVAYVFAPFFWNLTAKASKGAVICLCGLIAVLFLIDMVTSLISSNMGIGVHIIP